MTRFCTHCGSQLAANAAFCISCGNAAPSPNPNASTATPPPPNMNASSGVPPQNQQTYPPPRQAYPAAPTGKSSGAKVLLIVLCVFGGLTLMAAAGVIYVGYKAKQTATAWAREHGVGLEDLRRSGSSSARNIDACSLLTAQEAEQALGVGIERAERQGSDECHYYPKPGALDKARAQAEQKMKELQEAGSAPKDEQSKMSDLEKLVKGAVTSANDGSGMVFAVKVASEGGRLAYKGTKAALSMGGDFVKPLSGIGDDAWVDVMGSQLYFLKGDVMVFLDLRQVPQGREHGIAAAQKIVSRL